MADRERVLGDQHPDAIASRVKAAVRERIEAGEWSRATAAVDRRSGRAVAGEPGERRQGGAAP